MYDLGAKPISGAEALRFGNLVHEGLEAWYNNFWQGGAVAYEAASEAVAKGSPKAKADAYQQASALAMIQQYALRWGNEPMTVVAVEQQFEIPLVNPDTGGTSKTWKLAGKIDAIVEIGGKLYIVEHKTTSDDLAPESRYWAKLGIDGQVSGYYMGAKALGYDVVGCIYDVLKKPTLRPSKATAEADRKFTKGGELYANQRLNDESIEEWSARLNAEISNHTKYFRRLDVPRTDGDMIEYLADMWSVGREIAEAQSAGRWPRNPRSCDVYSGCPYFDVCAGGDSIENPVRFERGPIHPELQEQK
jgi:hypothetical protein